MDTWQRHDGVVAMLAISNVNNKLVASGSPGKRTHKHGMSISERGVARQIEAFAAPN